VRIADWASHSVAVLLRVYAKCIAEAVSRSQAPILDIRPEDTPDSPLNHRLEDTAPEIPDTSEDDGEEDQ
jgi:hypothetical protein